MGDHSDVTRGRRDASGPIFEPTQIRAWREHRGLKVRQLAELVGITHASLSRIERGGQRYRQELVEKIAAQLGVHPAALLWGKPDDDLDAFVIVGKLVRLSEDQRRTVARVIDAMHADLERGVDQ